MSEEEKATLEFIKINNKHRYCDKNDVDFLLNLIEKQQKELDNLKEIEKSHQEENGKLREELEQEKEKNMHLNEKNIMYKNSIPNQSNFYDFSNYISKNQIKEKIEELEKEQKEYKNGQEWEIQDDIVAQINILKDLLEV